MYDVLYVSHNFQHIISICIQWLPVWARVFTVPLPPGLCRGLSMVYENMTKILTFRMSPSCNVTAENSDFYLEQTIIKGWCQPIGGDVLMRHGLRLAGITMLGLCSSLCPDLLPWRGTSRNIRAHSLKSTFTSWKFRNIHENATLF